MAIWLDDNDGERIRTLDPAAPHGERVHYAKLSTVRPGTYLLLRRGTSGYGALDSLAARLLGDQAAKIEATQEAWKGELDRRIEARGIGNVEHDLRLHGVKTASRAWAWTDPSLILPKNDEDFRALLSWLGIPAEPTVSNAKRLRRAHYQAGSDVRETLEQAVEDSDLTELERGGRLDLRIRVEGFRDLVAARVVAVSPHAQVIPRRQARVPFEDRSARGSNDAAVLPGGRAARREATLRSAGDECRDRGLDRAALARDRRRTSARSRARPTSSSSSPERGILVIEVKSHRTVERLADGRWKLGNHAPTARGPFQQASEAMHSIRDYLLSTRRRPALGPNAACRLVHARPRPHDAAATARSGTTGRCSTPRTCSADAAAAILRTLAAGTAHLARQIAASGYGGAGPSRSDRRADRRRAAAKVRAGDVAGDRAGERARRNCSPSSTSSTTRSTPWQTTGPCCSPARPDRARRCSPWRRRAGRSAMGRTGRLLCFNRLLGQRLRARHGGRQRADASAPSIRSCCASRACARSSRRGPEFWEHELPDLRHRGAARQLVMTGR